MQRPKTSEFSSRGRGYVNNQQNTLNLQRELSRFKKEIEIGDQLDDFEIIDVLGRGSYGLVYKVISKINKQEYCLKRISVRNMPPEKAKNCLREVQILKKLKHPNIIKYYNSFIEDDNLYIVMEYASRGDFYKVLFLLFGVMSHVVL